MIIFLSDHIESRRYMEHNEPDSDDEFVPIEPPPRKRRRIRGNPKDEASDDDRKDVEFSDR